MNETDIPSLGSSFVCHTFDLSERKNERTVASYKSPGYGTLSGYFSDKVGSETTVRLIKSQIAVMERKLAQERKEFEANDVQGLSNGCGCYICVGR